MTDDARGMVWRIGKASAMTKRSLGGDWRLNWPKSICIPLPSYTTCIRPSLYASHIRIETSQYPLTFLQCQDLDLAKAPLTPEQTSPNTRSHSDNAGIQAFPRRGNRLAGAPAVHLSDYQPGPYYRVVPPPQDPRLAA